MIDISTLVQTVVARHIPGQGIAQLDNEDLIIQFLSFRHVARRIIILILISRDNSQADWKDVFQKASGMADTLTPKKLQNLYDICQDKRPLAILLDAHLQAKYCAEELRRRLKGKNVGWQFVQVLGKLATSETLKGLLKELKVDRIMTYHQDEEDDLDLQALALRSAFEAYERMKEKAGFPVPALVVQELPPDWGLPQMEPPPWDVLNAHILPLEWIEASQMFLPILKGETEKLPNKVHDALADHWEKWKTQKRTGRRESKSTEELDELGQLPWEDPSPPRVLSQMAILYRQAEQRWGKKGVLFLDALAEGRPVQEASQKAGFSRQTGQKYLRELKKENKSFR